MKRVVLGGILVVSGLIGFACAIDNPTEVSYPSDETFYRVRTDVLDFEATNREISETIDSLDSLNNYIKTYQSIYNFEQGDPSFLKVINAYDTAYFEDNILIVIPIEERSGAISHTIDAINIIEGTLTIDIIRNLPSNGTTDMAAWHLIIPLNVDKTDFESIELNIESSAK